MNIRPPTKQVLPFRMILHSDDENGACDCTAVVDSFRDRKAFKDICGLGDDGSGDGVRTVIPGGRGLGGSISTLYQQE